MTNHTIFERVGKPLEYKKGDLLFRQGEKNHFVYVVVNGLLKAYYETIEGKELVKSFIQEGEFIGSLISCYTGEASTFNLMCIENSTLRCISFHELKNSTIDQPKLTGNLINSLIELAIKKERREHEFLCLSAPERYALFKHRHPELINRLTQNDIARYIGITPVALSRIKQQR